MKRLLIIAVVFLFAASITAADGPTDKGSLILEGNASFSSISSDDMLGDESATIINIIPTIGYFISPNLLIGADIEFLKVSYGDMSGSSFGIGPSVGYYFNMDKTRIDAKGAVYPYIKGFFIYTSSKLEAEEEEEEDEEEVEFTTTTFGFQGGMIFMLSNYVGANFSARYSFDKYKPEGADESADGNTLNIGVGITAFIY